MWGGKKALVDIKTANNYPDNCKGPVATDLSLSQSPLLQVKITG